MKKVAIYLRVSTGQQDYERQRSEIEAYCQRNDYSICHTYEEKISGAKDERPQFQQLCKLTKDDIDAVIVWEISRLGRKLSTVINAVEQFKDKGINVISLKEHFELFDNYGNVTQQSTIMMSLFSTMAVIERDNIRDRTKSGKIEKMSKGELSYTFIAPYGYRMVNKMLEVNKAEAEDVRAMFHEYLQGFSVRKIAQKRNKEKAFVNRILKRSTYIGKPMSALLDREMECPAIIDEDTYIKVQKIMKERTTTKANTFSEASPFKGKLKCSICHHTLCKSSQQRYMCDCHKTSIQRNIMEEINDKVEQFYNKWFAESETEKKYQENLAEEQSKLKFLQEEEAEVAEKYNNNSNILQILISAGLSDKNLQETIGNVKKYEKEVNNIRKEIQSLQIKINELIKAHDEGKTSARFMDKVKEIVLQPIGNSKKLITYEFMDSTSLWMMVQTRTRRIEFLTDEM